MSQEKKKSYYFKLVVTLIHLALWAELGVITRVFLGKFFELGCDGGWGPCLDGGIYFRDLPANMLGSFVIGLFAASSTLGLRNDKPLALLPKGHSWQDNFEVQIGIRTGYCGSLTTFASWVLELVTAAVKRNEWVNMVLGFVVGLYAALASYLVGTHVALFVDRWLLPEREDVLLAALQYREDEMSMLEGEEEGGEGAAREALAMGLSPAELELEEWEPDLPTNLAGLARAGMLRRMDGAASAEASPQVIRRRLRQTSDMSAPAAVGPQGAGATRSQTPTQTPTQSPPRPPRVDGRRPSKPTAEAGDGMGRGSLDGVERGSCRVLVEEGPGGRTSAAPAISTATATAVEGSIVSTPRTPASKLPGATAVAESGGAGEAGGGGSGSGKLAWGDVETFMGSKTDCAALLALLLLTAALVAGVVREMLHTWLRQLWLETLLGPFGCVLRWWLSRFNYRLRGYWGWFPIGTFIANMTAVAIDFSLQCVLQRAHLGYWGRLALSAVMTGFCGSLSTVSTFVTEVVKYSELFPETLHTYSYAVYSIAGGALLGIVIYGWSVWVPL